MHNKKLTLKRIIIYSILSVLPLAVAAPIINHAFGEPMFTGKAAFHIGVTLFGMLAMLAPTFANIITRLVTKEGLKNSHLSFSLRNGKWKYYLLSILVPLAYGFTGFLLITKILLADMSWDMIINSEVSDLAPWVVISQIGGTIFLIFPFFGEEFGWRAYLTPKLTELMGEPAAVIVNGVIWGLWHAPLTLSGHNFGVDYKGFPFLGILCMCIMCISLSPFLTLITKRTGSVFPAAIAHGINNNAGAMIILSAVCTETAAVRISETEIIRQFFIMILPIFIVGLISYIILLRDRKKSEAAS